MKKIIYTCLLIITWNLNSIAQQTPANTVSDADAPVITFESDNHDFGTLKQGDNGTCEFKFIAPPLSFGEGSGVRHVIRNLQPVFSRHRA